MRKIKQNILPIIVLLLFEVCYFIFDNYPKSLINDYFPNFFTNLIWYIFYIAVLILIFKNIFLNENYYFVSQYFKDLLNCSIKILGIRLVLDIIINSTKSPIYINYINFILDIFFMLILFFIICQRLNKAKKVRINNKVIAFSFILIMVVILYVVISIYKTNQRLDFINYLDKKYLDIDLSYEIQSSSFELSIYQLLFNIISIFIIYNIFINTFESISQQNKVAKNTIAIRYILIIISFFSFCIAKMLVVPYNMLCSFNIRSANITQYSEPNNFERNYKTFELFRLQGYNSEYKLIYSKSKISIIYHNKTISTFKTKISQSEIKSIQDCGEGIYTFGSEAIMYLDNNKPIVILTSSLNNHQEDEKLTKVLEYLIKNKSFDFLEYSYEYMLKYDKDYIKSFLEDYSFGIYTENVNYNINKEFIMQFSKNALHNDFIE